jgi:hypothetical protein
MTPGITSDIQITSIAHVVQLAVAPVFLIAGIGAMLNVLTNRLARVVDRARRLAERLDGIEAQPKVRLSAEVAVLSKRAKLVHSAIACCAFCALLVCLVVVVLFLGAVFDLNASLPVAVLFIAAMTAFIAGLLFFLREIHLAITHLRIGPG